MAGHEQDELLQRWKMFQGINGVPFRTQQQNVPMYKNGDPAHKRPMMVADMHVKQFSLGEEAERVEMERVLDLVAKGKCYLSKMEATFDPNTGNYKALIIWGDLFLEDPGEREESISGRIQY